MALLKKRGRGEPEITQASMSDIAFLLLIFFITSAVFAMEEGLLLMMPGRQSTVAKIALKNAVRITSDPEGNVYVDEEPTEVHQIREIAKRKVAENDKTVFIIETHPQSEYAIMVSVLDELKVADARKISLKTAGD